jgi:ferritin-like metal-binding protein YciE
MANTKTDTQAEITCSGEFTDFFIDELKNIYRAEKHLLKGLPKMQKAATPKELAASFAHHPKATKEQVSRFEQLFELLDKKAVANKCEAMEGLVKEANGIIEETEKGTHIRDAGLTMAAQKVEHYEIATYGALVQLARVMGNDEVTQHLETTLEEEKQADSLLTELAESGINESEATETLNEDTAGWNKKARPSPKK